MLKQGSDVLGYFTGKTIFNYNANTLMLWAHCRHKPLTQAKNVQRHPKYTANSQTN